MEPEDGFVTHGAHAADFQPFKQAPDRTQTVTVSLINNANGLPETSSTKLVDHINPYAKVAV